MFTLSVDGEVSLVAQPLYVLPQDAHAQAVKRGYGHFFHLVLRDHFAHAFLHFIRCFVSESDGENAFRAVTLTQQVADARGDHPGLTGARASQDQHRSADRPCGLTLSRVEIVQAAA